MGTGELAALAAAALWACSSLFYGHTKLTAWQINFGKNILATVLLCLHLWVVTSLSDRPLFVADRNTWLMLLASSVIGIMIGDTLYFRSLQILGARRALIVSTTAPLFATIVGWGTLGESVSPISILGMLLTLGGVWIVVAERSASNETVGHFPGSPFWGVFTGLLGAVCTAVGAAFSRVGIVGSEAFSVLGSEAVFISGCDPLEATVIRVSTAALACFVYALLTGTLMKTARAAFQPAVLKVYAPAVVCGPWLGIWMSQVAYKHSMLAIAITLTCTTPLFVMPVLRIHYGYRITGRGLIGAIIAVAGVYLTVSGKS